MRAIVSRMRLVLVRQARCEQDRRGASRAHLVHRLIIRSAGSRLLPDFKAIWHYLLEHLLVQAQISDELLKPAVLLLELLQAALFTVMTFKPPYFLL